MENNFAKRLYEVLLGMRHHSLGFEGGVESFNGEDLNRANYIINYKYKDKSIQVRLRNLDNAVELEFYWEKVLRHLIPIGINSLEGLEDLFVMELQDKTYISIEDLHILDNCKTTFTAVFMPRFMGIIDFFNYCIDNLIQSPHKNLSQNYIRLLLDSTDWRRFISVFNIILSKAYIAFSTLNKVLLIDYITGLENAVIIFSRYYDNRQVSLEELGVLSHLYYKIDSISNELTPDNPLSNVDGSLLNNYIFSMQRMRLILSEAYKLYKDVIKERTEMLNTISKLYEKSNYIFFTET